MEMQVQAAKRFHTANAKPPVVERAPGLMGIDRSQDRESLGRRELPRHMRRFLYSLGTRPPKAEIDAGLRTIRSPPDLVGP